MDNARFEIVNLKSHGLPFNCLITNYIATDKEKVITPHWHYHIELIFCILGSAKVNLGGKIHEFSKGDLVIINSQQVHSFYFLNGQKAAYIVIQFVPEVLYSTTSHSLFEFKYILPFTMANIQHQNLINSRELQQTDIPQLIHKIYDEFKNQSYGFELSMKALICMVFTQILRNWEKNSVKINIGASIKEVNLIKIQKTLDYLKENYTQDISLESAAKICNLSYSYFSRTFKVIMGKSFIEYLNYIRISEAERLLICSDLNVTQIALNVGYSNPSYFIRQFKRLKGICPTIFRTHSGQL